MIRTRIALLAMCATVLVGRPQPPMAAAQSAPTQIKHYRLTFVLSYPNTERPPQTFVLDVPVTNERPGMAASAIASELTGQPETAVSANLQCTNVHESTTGLAVQVSFFSDSEVQPMPGSAESQHRNLKFERKVDVPLGKSTLITDELRVVPLGKTAETAATPLVPAPKITMTAAEI